MYVCMCICESEQAKKERKLYIEYGLYVCIDETSKQHIYTRKEKMRDNIINYLLYYTILYYTAE